jgi:nicotinate-nucleotide pyrophosphorylase (carboxylating)
LQTLSATATASAAFVAAVAGTGATILDTRKTLPGLRTAQKYAVRCGGAENHRQGLFDAILLKENHIETSGSVEASIAAARATAGPMLVEVEVETLEQLRNALASDVDRIMLDDFSLDQLRAAVGIRNETNPSIRLEASGGVTLGKVREIAATGVDYISVGSITKDIKAVDFSLRVIETV